MKAARGSVVVDFDGGRRGDGDGGCRVDARQRRGGSFRQYFGATHAVTTWVVAAVR